MTSVPTLILVFAAGLFSGAVLTWLAMRRRASDTESRLKQEIEKAREELWQKREAFARLEAELLAREKTAEERERARDELKNAFDALAAKALRASNEQFLELAEVRLGSSEKKAAEELEKRKQSISELVGPISQNLEKLRDVTQNLEAKREKAYGELRAQLSDMGRATRELHESAGNLTSVLKGSSQARGRWGEMALRNIVEMAGMTEHCDFLTQSTDQAGRRPDMVVRLPGSGLIPVDAKAPFVEYEKYISETDEARRLEHLKAHEAALRTQVRELGQRDYAGHLDTEIDFTVLFLPAEAMLAAAFDANPALGEEALQRRVLLATPVTLIALLRTVGIYWRQEKLAENAGKVLDAARTFHERVFTFQDHLGKVGKGLSSAVQAYNKAVGTFSNRILPAGRRVEDLVVGGDGTKKLVEPEELDTSPRQLEGDGQR